MEHGVSQERVHFFGKPLSLEEHLDNLASVDMALDPFPYQGTMTSLDCLSVGTPIVSLCGEFYVRRATAGMLLRIGFDNLVASNVEEYKCIALSLLDNRDNIPQLSPHYSPRT